MKQVENLKKENEHIKTELSKKDEKIMDLEMRIDAFEQYSRNNNFIITGLKTNHLSYADATKSDTQGNIFNEDGAGPRLEEQDISFLN